MAAECPCGWESPYDPESTLHRKMHLLWDRGIPMKPRDWADVIDQADRGDVEEGAILVVYPHRRARLNKMAYTMSRLMQREGRYDFPSWPMRLISEWQWRRDGGEQALLALRDNRVVGYLKIRRLAGFGLYDVRGDTWSLVGEWQKGESPAVDMIFVCRGYRRAGVATSLVRRFMELNGASPDSIVWGGPLTRCGHSLAASFRSDGYLFIG